MEPDTPNTGQPDSLIQFSCSFCGRQIKMPREYAGRKGKCPQCKSVLVVPESTPAAPPDEPIRLRRGSAPPAEAARPIYTEPHPPPPEPAEEPSGRLQAGISGPGQHKPVTLIDILSFPFSLAGAIHFLLFCLTPALVALLQNTVLLICCYGQILALASYIFLTGYFYYYLTNCVIAGAKGERFAPDISFEDFPSIIDLLRRLLLLVMALLVCLAPAFVYIFYKQFWDPMDMPAWVAGPILYIWIAIGLFFLPMLLLALCLFDSVSAFNPRLIIGSIFSTFLPYCGLVLLFYLIGFLMFLIPGWHPVLALLSWIIDVYLIFICAYVLGRFFRSYEKRLNWEIGL